MIEYLFDFDAHTASPNQTRPLLRSYRSTMAGSARSRETVGRAREIVRWSGRYRRNCQAMDVDPPSGARAIVLVEGISDKAALETLAERRGTAICGAAIRIVAMGGVTNLGRYIAALNIEPRSGINLTGLSDPPAQ